MASALLSVFEDQEVPAQILCDFTERPNLCKISWKECSALKTEERKYVIVVDALKHLVAPCASSPCAPEGYQTACLSNCIDCRSRAVLQCECACVLSDYQTECKTSRTGHT